MNDQIALLSEHFRTLVTRERFHLLMDIGVMSFQMATLPKFQGAELTFVGFQLTVDSKMQLQVNLESESFVANSANE